MSKIGWSQAETNLLRRCCEERKSDVEIAQEINRHFKNRRTAYACYRRALKLGLSMVWTDRPSKSERRYGARAIPRYIEGEEASNYWADATHWDAQFQAAMLREGREPSAVSTTAGTDQPTAVPSTAVGSCTSSAGWV